MYDFSDFTAESESIFEILTYNSVYQCIMQWLVIGLLIAILVFVILIFIKLRKGIIGNSRPDGGRMLDDRSYFCKNCGNQCSATDIICSKCGSRRV